MTMPTQNFANHRRLVPSFHVVLFFLIIGDFIYTLIHLYRHRTAESLSGVIVAVALGLVFFHMRGFATILQDRIIRLEESLRYERCLSPDLAAKAAGLPLRQMISMRFASDAELPALAQQAVDGKLAHNEIKPQIKQWRADHLRV